MKFCDKIQVFYKYDQSKLGIKTIIKKSEIIYYPR